MNPGELAPLKLLIRGFGVRVPGGAGGTPLLRGLPGGSAQRASPRVRAVSARCAYSAASVIAPSAARLSSSAASRPAASRIMAISSGSTCAGSKPLSACGATRSDRRAAAHTRCAPAVVGALGDADAFVAGHERRLGLDRPVAVRGAHRVWQRPEASMLLLVLSLVVPGVRLVDNIGHREPGAPGSSGRP